MQSIKSGVLGTSQTDDYSIRLNLHNIDPGEFLYLSTQVGARLGWTLVQESETHIVFSVSSTTSNYQQEVSIQAEDTRAYLISRSLTTNSYDYEQNANNILNFQNAFRDYYLTLLQRQRVSYNPFPTQRTTFIQPTTNTSQEKINTSGGWGGLIPSRQHFITPVLIYLNVLVFLLMTFSGISPFDPPAYALLDWGGNFRPLFIEGEYWRLFTYMFLHAGIMHLAGNTFALLYIGLHLEPLLGKLRYASAYVLSGVAAGIASMAVHGFSVGVGASGAIFGLYGVFFALLTTNLIPKTLRTTLLRSLLFFIVYNLLYGLSGNIDNAAHIGGLVSGMGIGYTYIYGLRKQHKQPRQLSTILLLAIALTVVIFYSLNVFK